MNEIIRSVLSLLGLDDLQSLTDENQRLREENELLKIYNRRLTQQNIILAKNIGGLE